MAWAFAGTPCGTALRRPRPAGRRSRLPRRADVRRELHTRAVGGHCRARAPRATACARGAHAVPILLRFCLVRPGNAQPGGSVEDERVAVLNAVDAVPSADNSRNPERPCENSGM